MERHFEHDLEELKERCSGWLVSRSALFIKRCRPCFKRTKHSLRAFSKKKKPSMKCRSKSTIVSCSSGALQQPMAVDLRFILSASRINNDLERIGDQAVNIAQSALRILRHPQVKPYVDLPRMSEFAEGMVRDSLNALVRRDAELAKSVLFRDDEVDHLRDQIFRELLTYMMENSAVVFPAFELMLVTKNLERIGDHATNIAEDVIYMVAGRDVRHLAADRR